MNRERIQITFSNSGKKSRIQNNPGLYNRRNINPSSDAAN
ncbi:unnamed protein product [marine sediment metagenome]|uniref:Uncharacterized protein n=1 Tax=marine sediment metagenome TaxID=412755 RepID=X1UBC9_9ZZZZ